MYTSTEYYSTSLFLDKEQYEKNLKTRQEEHLKSVQRFQESRWRPCLHDSCPACLGTGIKVDGSFCIHNLSCSCPKCTPTC